jgi:hypothetical protein
MHHPINTPYKIEYVNAGVKQIYIIISIYKIFKNRRPWRAVIASYFCLTKRVGKGPNPFPTKFKKMLGDSNRKRVPAAGH